jgi:hypothetical protein
MPKRTLPCADKRATARRFHFSLVALSSRLPALILSDVKPPDVYTDWRIVAGAALIILGASNWILGLQRTRQYSQMIAAAAHAAAATDYRSFDELEPNTGTAVIEPLTPRARELSYATARMDFYHAIFLTGRVLVLAGVVVILLGFMSVIQRDARAAVRRANSARNPAG